MQTKDYAVVREWAQDIVARPGLSSPFLKTVAETVLDLLPNQTMADVEWDDDTHHLTGATSPGGDVVMMWRDVDDTEQIICVDSAWYPVQLTPNGKKYKLVEVTVSSRENVGLDQPEHPKILKTKQDFEDAPDWTVVESDTYTPWVRLSKGMWRGAGDFTRSSSLMAECGPGHVLRWGCEL